MTPSTDGKTIVAFFVDHNDSLYNMSVKEDSEGAIKIFKNFAGKGLIYEFKLQISVSSEVVVTPNVESAISANDFNIQTILRCVHLIPYSTLYAYDSDLADVSQLFLVMNGQGTSFDKFILEGANYKLCDNLLANFSKTEYQRSKLIKFCGDLQDDEIYKVAKYYERFNASGHFKIALFDHEMTLYEFLNNWTDGSDNVNFNHMSIKPEDPDVLVALFKLKQYTPKKHKKCCFKYKCTGRRYYKFDHPRTGQSLSGFFAECMNFFTIVNKRHI